MYLLDTNIVSEARRGRPAAVNWLRSVAGETIFLSVLTLGEITRGIALKEKSDRQMGARLSAWLETLRQNHDGKILPITDQIAIEWGRIGAVRSRGDADGLIAATAIVHGLILVTRNVVDFEDLPIPIVNPWAERSL